MNAKISASRLIIIAALFSILVMTGTVPVDAQQEGYRTWSNSDYGIKLTYPTTWTLDERPETVSVPCVIEAGFGADTTAQRDPFGAFVMPILIGEGYFDDVSTLADTWTVTARDDWGELEGLSRSSVRTVQGHPAIELKYKVTDRDDNQISWLVWLILTEDTKKAWVMAYGGMDEYEIFYSAAMGIFESAEFDG